MKANAAAAKPGGGGGGGGGAAAAATTASAASSSGGGGGAVGVGLNEDTLGGILKASATEYDSIECRPINRF